MKQKRKVEIFLEKVQNIQKTIEDLKQETNLQMFQNKSNFQIDTDKPIVVIFSSDVHFGSIFTDYEMLTEIWQTIITHERVFIMVNGDFIDNFELPVPKLLLAGINSQLISPILQRQFYITYIESLLEQNKLIAMTLGNHEEFTNSDIFLKVSEKVAIGLNRILVNLTVGSQTYKIALIHKSRFNSTLNPTHSSLRELHLNYPYADTIVTSHTHTPSLQSIPYPKDEDGHKMIYLIKTGSLKNKDLYTYKLFDPYNVSEISTPAVIFFPDKYKMVGFSDFRDALIYLRAFEV